MEHRRLTNLALLSVLFILTSGWGQYVKELTSKPDPSYAMVSVFNKDVKNIPIQK